MTAAAVPPVLTASTSPVAGEASGALSVPRSAGTPLTVEAWEVEHGDILFGLHHPVDSILTDGTWWFFGDAHGAIIAKRAVGSRVQVVRGGTDDCDPHGIERPARHLEAVR